MKTPMRAPILALALAVTALPAAAFERLTSADDFVRTIVGRELSRTGIRLRVLPEGQVEGRAFGYPVTGNWRWQDGYFCRTLDWGGYEIAYNCQAVLANGRRARFVSDRGTGQSADFRLN